MAGIPIGIGLDLIDLNRFTCLYGGEDPELLARCFSQAELMDAGAGCDRIARLAARFAAKEAAYKAFGGGENIALTDIVVHNDASGAPALALSGAAKEAAERRGVTVLLVSLTHSDSAAAAVVVALSGGPK
jgi:holo-[acyl-carrier protein] synthase